MDNNQIVEIIQQYAQQGKDINALLADYQTLAASGKTPLGLNQWIKTDKPRMEDFNEDNRIIDEKLRDLIENKVSYAAFCWTYSIDGIVESPSSWDDVINALPNYTTRFVVDACGDLFPNDFRGTAMIAKGNVNYCYIDFVSQTGERYFGTYRSGFSGWKKVALT